MNPKDLEHLRRCIDLAREARDRGDDPFGSVLVSAGGEVLAERSNQVQTTRDCTAHPELALARFASIHLSESERRGATMYTSGEHCPMCAAAHVWAKIGRLVFVLPGERIGQLFGPSETAIVIGAREVVERSNVEVRVEGPCEELVDEAAALFTR